MKEPRKIIHVDMDAFYASVEILDNQELKGKAVIVGGSPKSRGVVCAASYEARKFGVHSALACAEAYRRCPKAIFLPPRFERYKEISRKINEIFHRYSDLIEPLSLDEAWIDVTDNLKGIPSATWVAMQIKKDILNETGLIASAGVSFNKFLAKIASDEDKPDGLFVVTPQKAPDFLKSLPVKKIPGVGKVTGARLGKEGIILGSDLLRYRLDQLQAKFGKLGTYLFHIIRGEDNREVRTSRISKSIGMENTFAEDLSHGPRLVEKMGTLLEGLYKRLQKAEKQGRTITLKIKFADFKQITRGSTSVKHLDFEEIQSFAYDKLMEVCEKEAAGRKIRLIGLSLGNFDEPTNQAQVKPNPFSNEQLDLFSWQAS